jgi:hypothetical protein
MDNQGIITIRLDLCELKSKVLNIALSLEDDKKYSRKDAVGDLLMLVRQIETLEELNILNKAT